MEDEQLEILRLLFEPFIVKQTRHQDYKHTIERKSDYKAMISGIGLDSFIPRYERRETVEEYVASLLLTNQIVTPATNQVLTAFRYTSRLEGITRKIFYLPESISKTEIMTAQTSNFWAGQDVDYYIRQVIDNSIMSDPNAFLIVDFAPFAQDERPKCYPLIIGCEDIVAFEYQQGGDLSWLLISRSEVITDKDGKEIVLMDYVAYLGDVILIYHEHHEARDHRKYSAIGRISTDNDSKTYQIERKDVLAGRVQAERLGYLYDEATDGRTCISALEHAIPFVKDLMSDKRGYDLSKLSHVFPQKLQFVENCPGESNRVRCDKGRTVPGGKECSKCGGHGYIMHMGAQDTLTLPMPSTKEDYFLPLSEIIHYAKADLEAVKHLREDIDSGTAKIQWAVFCSKKAMQVQAPTGPGNSLQIHKTATEYAIDADSENNTLQPFTEQKSRLFKFIVWMIAKFNDVEENIKVLYEYPANLRMVTLEELEANYQNAVVALSPPFMLDQKADEVAFKKFANDPEGLQRYKVRSMLQPFRHRTSEDIQFSIGNGSVPKWMEVLWANFEYILSIVEADNTGFYRLPPKKQRELVKLEAEAIEDELTPIIISPFGAKDTETDPLAMPDQQAA